MTKKNRTYEVIKNFLKTNIRSLSFYASGTIILSITFFFCQLKNIPVAILFRDPSSTAGLPFYSGWISSLGIVFWTAGCSIVLFTSYFLKNIERRYFLGLGSLMMMLLTDDFFMLHDGLFRVVHIPEIFIFFVYAFFGFSVFTTGRKVLIPIEIFQLLTGFGFLGMSIFIDIFQSYLENHISNRILLEDGAKFLGIIGLFCHSLTISLKHLNFIKK